ncbi:MAG: prepilin-type N-terminal cleavage/methylation domain-containing protein, partial [Bacilli bacterium]|nr:prepilin-type N-terminal cleavage/methylation domain-containing protein [Bacilli bacterium]
NKKGFTLVELIAVVVVLIIIMLISVNVVNNQIKKSRVNAFIKEANTFAKAALEKYADDKMDEEHSGDIFHGEEKGRTCYSLDMLASKYVTKTQNKYTGSIEVCSGPDCTYQTKMWITDGERYIDGLSPISDDSGISNSFSSTPYYLTCGVLAIGGGSKGSRLTSEFEYTGKEEVMDIVVDGVYSLEAWGAQGGTYQESKEGGYGAYAYTELKLYKGDKLYINVGEQGYPECTVNDASCKASYNGGSKGSTLRAGGGGASSIATKSGKLYDLNKNVVYLIAGAGAGGTQNNTDRFFLKHGGGYANLYWPNDREYGDFGRFGGFKQSDENYYGNGGGYSSSTKNSTTFTNGDNFTTVGGTSYVFHPKTKNGVMYSYECTGYDLPQGSRTECGQLQGSTSKNLSDEPISKSAKLENGYVKISYLVGGFTS